MATIFSQDLTDITSEKAALGVHIRRPYLVLSGITNNITHVINFTGDASFGESNNTAFGVLGDVDFDGVVTEDDATLIQEFAVGVTTPTDEQLERALVSGEDEVSSFDASLVLQYVDGLINTFPAGNPAPRQSDLDDLSQDEIVGPRFNFGVENNSNVRNSLAIGKDARSWHPNQIVLSSDTDFTGSQKSRHIYSHVTNFNNREKTFFVRKPPSHIGVVPANIKLVASRARASEIEDGENPPIGIWEWEVFVLFNSVVIINEDTFFSTKNGPETNSSEEYFDVELVADTGAFLIEIEDKSYDFDTPGVPIANTTWTCYIEFIENANAEIQFGHTIDFTPNGGGFPTGTNVTIAGSAQGGDENYVHTIERSTDGGDTWNPIATETTTGDEEFEIIVQTTADTELDEEVFRVITESDGETVTTESNVFAGTDTAPINLEVEFDPEPANWNVGQEVEIFVTVLEGGDAPYNIEVDEIFNSLSDPNFNTTVATDTISIPISLGDAPVLVGEVTPAAQLETDSSVFEVTAVSDDLQSANETSDEFIGVGFASLAHTINYTPNGGDVADEQLVVISGSGFGGDFNYTHIIETNYGSGWVQESTQTTSGTDSFNASVVIELLQGDTAEIRVRTSADNSTPPGDEVITTSNEFEGVGVPEVTVDDSPIAITLREDETETIVRTISNTGAPQSTLDVTIIEPNVDEIDISPLGPFAIDEGDSQDINIQILPEFVGTVNETIFIDHNGQNVSSPIEIPVEIEILPAIDIDLSPSPLDFGTNFTTDNDPEISFTVTNNGQSAETVAIAIENSPDLRYTFVSSSSFVPFTITLQPGETYNDAIRLNTSAAGTFTADLRVRLDDINGDMLASSFMTGNVESVPAIITDESTMLLSAAAGETDEEERTIANAGETGSILSGTIMLVQDSNGWLSLSFGGGSFSIDQGDEISYVVAFGPPPNTTESVSGQIVITHNDPNTPSPIEIPVDGINFGGGGTGGGTIDNA